MCVRACERASRKILEIKKHVTRRHFTQMKKKKEKGLPVTPCNSIEACRQRDRPVRRTAGLDTLKPKLQTVVYDILPSGGRCRKAVFGVRISPHSTPRFPAPSSKHEGKDVVMTSAWSLTEACNRIPCSRVHTRRQYSPANKDITK